ncbi:MAG: type I methionyl aminopeptidase [Chloroflexi bacterium]|nr:type I methionyl aminopeptidase [Chloroflexota bacterium]|tara:strand:- start:108 stop:857 length:750 start_codon:yes stop_codon:yes gene_type:complete
MISLKSNSEIEIMREAGFIVASAVMEAFDVMEPGITTKELDNITCSVIKKQGAKPAFLGLYGFPATACVSINNEIVHGIPSDDRIIKNGDIVTIDCGAIVDGLYSDHAVSKIAGEDINNNRTIIETTKGSLNQAIKEIKPGNRLGDVSNAVESYVRPKGFELVREYVGHGIGRQLHEPPQVPNIGSPSTGIELRPGLVLAIEPMLTAGGWETEKLDDDWTVVTKDGSMSCHFEHTVAVTDIGFDILTKI